MPRTKRVAPSQTHHHNLSGEVSSSAQAAARPAAIRPEDPPAHGHVRRTSHGNSVAVDQGTDVLSSTDATPPADTPAPVRTPTVTRLSQLSRLSAFITPPFVDRRLHDGLGHVAQEINRRRRQIKAAENHLEKQMKIFIEAPPPSFVRQLRSVLPGMLLSLTSTFYVVPKWFSGDKWFPDFLTKRLLTAQLPAASHVVFMIKNGMLQFNKKQLIHILLKSGVITFGVQFMFGGMLRNLVGLSEEVATPAAAAFSTVILAKLSAELKNAYIVQGKALFNAQLARLRKELKSLSTLSKNVEALLKRMREEAPNAALNSALQTFIDDATRRLEEMELVPEQTAESIRGFMEFVLNAYQKEGIDPYADEQLDPGVESTTGLAIV